MVAVNWLIACGLFGTLWQQKRFLSLLREQLLAALPLELALQVIAGVSLFFIPLLGLGVLLPLGPVMLLPTLALPALARSRDVSRLDRSAVTRHYARALSARLGLTRSQRRTMLAAATLSCRPTDASPTKASATEALPPLRSGLLRGPLPPAPIDISSDPAMAWKAWHVVRQASERWDGPDGLDGQMRGRLLPVEARLLAVAVEWAQLTAAGGPRLTQREAALALASEAGTRFDPHIVEAAGEIVTVEEQFASLETFQPRLDLLPLPRVVRRELLPWALHAYSPAA
jgi:hypothetical protein